MMDKNTSPMSLEQMLKEMAFLAEWFAVNRPNEATNIKTPLVDIHIIPNKMSRCVFVVTDNKTGDQNICGKHARYMVQLENNEHTLTCKEHMLNAINNLKISQIFDIQTQKVVFNKEKEDKNNDPTPSNISPDAQN
jgi:hypothetical protein